MLALKMDDVKSLHAGNFSCFCCRLLTFSKLIFPKYTFSNTIRVSNSLDPDQDWHSLGPDMGPNSLQFFFQQTTKVAASKERVKYGRS